MSEKLAIPKPTLRFWEKELEGIIVPLRTPGGQRRYNEKHLALVKNIKELKNNGLSLQEIRETINIDKDNSVISDEINRLSDRIAETIRSELFNFFKYKYYRNG